VPQFPDNPDAVVLLPPVRGRLRDRTLLRWLSQGRLEKLRAPVDPLAEVLRVLGREYPSASLAALRMWGQTGDRPRAWIAAADPVYMEPQLDRLFLHVLGPGDVSKPELRLLFDALQAALGGDGSFGFARLGSCGYIRSEQPMVTSAVPAALLNGQNPGGSLPAADVAADTLNLISEIEMTLHAQPVNAERQSRGQPPVNSLWLWGGGYAPEQSRVPVPPLYTDEPLLRGYWESISGEVGGWPGTIGACLDAAPAGFVASVSPGEGGDAILGNELAAVRDALRAGRLRRVVLVAADGLRATLHRSDRFRVWRRIAPLLEDPAA
jgi:hypothetical protein